MSKPEVVAYMWEHRGRHACVDRAYAEQLMDDGEQVAPLIRLTDHERLQAEAERLQADHEAERAADKARIAELTEALKSAREMVSDWGAYASEYFREKHGLEKDLAELDATIDAALAQQGKEGE